jgi:metal-responsive CopG/Arc/MetJ family transcriptional regulator
MRKEQMTVRFDKDTLHRIDLLINKKKFDNRPQIIRRAVNDFLEQQEKVIFA